MANKISRDYDVKESLEAAEYIAKRAKEVQINACNLEKLTEKISNVLIKKELLKKLHTVFWRPEAYPDISDSKAVDWLFVFHTLNFTLFYPKSTNNKQWTAGNTDGYSALCFAIKRAIDEGKPLWDPNYYTKLTQNELEYILRSDDGETSIPLIDERLSILHEVGETLKNKYEGTFVECVKSSDYNADKLVKLLFDEFESYRDEAIYEGVKVRLHTKANSLVSDIWACYRKQNKFNFNTINMMSTMFIEYRSPMVLLHFGVLHYSDKLVKKLENNNEPLEYGSREELEIRGCSLAVANRLHECLKNYILSNAKPSEIEFVKSVLKTYNSTIMIDNFFLGYLAETFHKCCIYKEPFHYVKSVHY